MIRMSRLTDYGIVLMRYLAMHPERVHTATEVADGARLPLPTVGKLLRKLTREGVLVSHRGVKGGYSLARTPEKISVAGVIRAVEGPVGLTVCSEPSGDCDRESSCPVGGHIHRINRAIWGALEGMTISDMLQPPPVDTEPPGRPHSRPAV